MASSKCPRTYLSAPRHFSEYRQQRPAHHVPSSVVTSAEMDAHLLRWTRIGAPKHGSETDPACEMTSKSPTASSALLRLQDLVHEIHHRGRLCLATCSARDAEGFCIPSLRDDVPLDSRCTMILCGCAWSFSAPCVHRCVGRKRSLWPLETEGCSGAKRRKHAFALSFLTQKVTPFSRLQTCRVVLCPDKQCSLHPKRTQIQ